MSTQTLVRGFKALGMAAVAMLCACTESVTTFPPGLEPWEPNLASLPTGTTATPFPEELSMVRTTWTDASTMVQSNSVHAKAYVRAPLSAVWPALRDPQTGRDPTASDGFRVLAYAMDPTYQFTFRTEVTVSSPISLVWEVDWRHGVVNGTLEEPRVTATRWQKTGGTDIIDVIEGSAVAQAVAGHPEITEVDYQYHLAAFSSDYTTIENYLRAIFSRLKDRAHGVALSPNDCVGCPTPPAGY